MAMGRRGTSDGSSSSSSSSSAVSLALRIATVALSVASAALMASASQRSCTTTSTCSPAMATTSQQQQQVQVSYSDYSSLSYALVANVVSALLQATAAWLTARRKVDESKAFKSLSELVDTAAQVLLYSSSALSFSVDDFGTCGRRIAGVCSDDGGEFCRRVRASGPVSMAAVALAASKYLKDVPVSAWFTDDGDDDVRGKKKKTKTGCGCGRGCHCHH